LLVRLMPDDFSALSITLTGDAMPVYRMKQEAARRQIVESHDVWLAVTTVTNTLMRAICRSL
jgi:hypothetical protein